MDILKSFELLFFPKTIAVVGASNDETKFGSRYLATLQEFGYTGRIYPVHPKETEVRGLKAYPAVQAIPEPGQHRLTIASIIPSDRNARRAIT